METPAAPSISLTAQLVLNDGVFTATCPEIPGPEGKGPTDMEALMSLKQSMDEYFENGGTYTPVEASKE